MELYGYFEQQGKIDKLLSALIDYARGYGQEFVDELQSLKHGQYTKQDSLFGSSVAVIDLFNKKIEETNSHYNNLKLEKIDLKSFINLGARFCKDVGGALEITEQKAFASLWRIAFQSANDVLDRFWESEANLNNVVINPKKILYNMFDISRNINSNWNYCLLDYPAVSGLRWEIEDALEIQGYSTKILNEFRSEYGLSFYENLKGDNNIKEEFFGWWDSERDLREYLEYAEKYKIFYEPPTDQFQAGERGIEEKPLYSYYVRQYAVGATQANWILNDMEVIEDEKVDYNERPLAPVCKVMHSFLEDYPSSQWWYIIFGANFGIGKTSMARMIVSEFAIKCLCTIKSSFESASSIYIPILVYLRNGKNHPYVQGIVRNLLNQLAPESKRNRKILLVLDGLDEYVESFDFKSKEMGLPELLKDILDLETGDPRTTYPKIKIVITTRIMTTRVTPLPQKLVADFGIGSRSCKRLLPFMHTQVNEFFEYYFTPDELRQFKNIYNEYPSSEFLEKRLKNGRMSVSDKPKDKAQNTMRRPLFIWMFSLIHSKSNVHIEFKRGWSENAIASCMYMFFIHYVIKGKYKKENQQWLKYVTAEKKSLRGTAILKQIHKDNLLWEDLVDHLAALGITEVSNNPSHTNKMPLSILASYLQFECDEMKGITKMDFLHRTLQEYLIAEFYVWSMLDDKDGNGAYHLNIGFPTEQTINFFLGLIELLKPNETGDDAVIVSDEDQKITVLQLLNFAGKKSEAISRLMNSAKQYLVSDDITLVNSRNIASGPWQQMKIGKQESQHLWMHRWIALLLLNRLIPPNFDSVVEGRKIFKEKIVELFKYSHRVPGSIISKLQLQNIDLSDSNMTRAELSGINLNGALLNYATLKYANLSDANLSDANLSDSKLSHADLSSADLSHADLSSADLSHADLSSADLSHAIVFGANLSDADLSSALIVGVNFAGAKSTTNMKSSP